MAQASALSSRAHAARQPRRHTMRAATQLVCVLVTVAPLAQAAVPGTFFWKPRVGLDIAVPTHYPRTVKKPTWGNVANGYVVIIEGYQAGLTIAALASYLEDVREAYPHLHPGKAHYYTNAYRWFVRHLSLIPDWFGGKRSNYMTTHKVWTKRWFYMDYFLPKWMRKILFFVDEDSWKYEEWEYKKFQKHAEPHFGKYYRYPSKRFDNYNSMRQALTVENMDVTDNSLDNPKNG